MRVTLWFWLVRNQLSLILSDVIAGANAPALAVPEAQNSFVPSIGCRKPAGGGWRTGSPLEIGGAHSESQVSHRPRRTQALVPQTPR